MQAWETAKNEATYLLKKSNVPKWIKSLIRACFLVGIGFVMVYPVLFMLSASFKTVSDTFDPTVVWIPSSFHLYNFRLAFEFMNYGKAITRTLVVVIPSVALQLVSCLFVSYGFARFKFKGQSILFGLLLFNVIVPVQTYMIPQFVNASNMGLLDTPVLFYLQAALGTGIRSGLYIFILRQFFRGMPKELEEASLIDGCGPMRTFLKIMVPNVGPALLTVAVFSVVWYYNDYELSGMFFKNNFPVSFQIMDVKTLLNNRIQKSVGGMSGANLRLLTDSILSASCLIVALPLIAMYLLVQRFFTEGVERTGIVG